MMCIRLHYASWRRVALCVNLPLVEIEQHTDYKQRLGGSEAEGVKAGFEQSQCTVSSSVKRCTDQTLTFVLAVWVPQSHYSSSV